MAEMTVQEAKTLLTDWAEWLNDKHETWREVNLTDKEGEQIAALIEQQAAEIERMKCCGNCNNWVNRPEKMSCKIHGIDVAQWCRCGEWLEKEAEVQSA